MIDNKEIRQTLRRLKRIRTWQLIVLLFISLLVSASLLRINNVGMVSRRDAVYSADKSGDDAVTQARLYDLQRYVSSHMNTDIGGPITLASTYNRDYQTLMDQAASEDNPNGNIYQKAQDVCAPKFSRWSTAYVQCTVDELSKYPSLGNLTSAVDLNPALYTYSFASIAWSPDFAGWSVVISVVIFIMILTRFIGVAILKIIIKSRYSGM